MASSMGGGMARGPERLCGGTRTRLCAGAGSWGRRRAWTAAPSAGGGGSAGAGGGHDLGTRSLGLAGTMDMGTGALGLSASPLRPLGTRPLVASGRTLVLGPGALDKTVARRFFQPHLPAFIKASHSGCILGFGHARP